MSHENDNRTRRCRRKSQRYAPIEPSRQVVESKNTAADVRSRYLVLSGHVLSADAGIVFGLYQLQLLGRHVS
jgi:hypothetical protein